MYIGWECLHFFNSGGLLLVVSEGTKGQKIASGRFSSN
jgi:hypothetical protein